MSERTEERSAAEPLGGKNTQPSGEADGEGGRAAMHRLRNELYSATLALRTVIALIDRGDVRAARQAAERMLEQLCGPADGTGGIAPTRRPEASAESP